MKIGDRVASGDVVAAVEAMKMECPVHSAVDGVVRRIVVRERQSVRQGTPMIGVEPLGPMAGATGEAADA